VLLELVHFCFEGEDLGLLLLDLLPRHIELRPDNLQLVNFLKQLVPILVDEGRERSDGLLKCFF